MEWNNEKRELNPISTEEWLWQLSAIYGYNGTEFSYAIFTEQRNFTMAEQRNGNGRTAIATEERQWNGGNQA